MRGTQPVRLLGAASLAVMVTALSFADAAQGESREARMCATQTESLADQRIAACAGMLSAGLLHGKAEGVAYGLRGLAYLDRGDIAHAIADLNQAIALAPDFAPAYQNRGNAWYGRGNYGHAIADYDTPTTPDPSPLSLTAPRPPGRRALVWAAGAGEFYKRARPRGADSPRLY